jgi:DNA-binding CsgD family transcriptional regulator
MPAAQNGRTPAELAQLLAELVGAEPGDLVAVAVLTAAPPGAQRPGGDGDIENGAADARWPGLTKRELAVAVLAGQAMTNRQIARRLAISQHTVSYHLRQIFRKLRIGSRVHLARLLQERPARPPTGEI